MKLSHHNILYFLILNFGIKKSVIFFHLKWEKVNNHITSRHQKKLKYSTCGKL
ncbi:hypothetical protein ECP030529315_3728 [Escherichia coli p0305293.15]|nr:hypothetical protein ECENVIRA811_1965 [Escherichia coli Envira 8/11]ENG49436.1 hypothetical protein ECP030529315_3728 [Escherichia coli p0305293.15]